MPGKTCPNNVLEQSCSALSVWKQLDKFTVGKLTAATLEIENRLNSCKSVSKTPFGQ